MSFFRDILNAIADIFNPISRAQLSDFQKRKILHEFNTFYDKNKDGSIEWKDFEIARQHICKLSGWKEGTPKYKRCQELFREIWSNLQVEGDSDTDGSISQEEWINMWTNIYRAKLLYEREKVKQKSEEGDEKKDEDGYIPAWFNKYIEYKFNLYDRAGDGVIDAEEFEYTLSDGFNMPAKDCRNAFMMFSEAGQKKVDLPYFRELALQYYLSNDPVALGNFINGRLSYEWILLGCHKSLTHNNLLLLL